MQPLRRGRAELLQLSAGAQDGRQIPWPVSGEPLGGEGERPDGFQVGVPADRHVEVGGRSAAGIGGRKERPKLIVGILAREMHADESADQPAAERRHSYGHDLPP